MQDQQLSEAFADADASIALSLLKQDTSGESFLPPLQQQHVQEAVQDETQQEDPDDQYEDFGTRNYRPYNRGNKLKRTIEQAVNVSHRPTLWKVHAIDEDTEFAHVGKRRAIVRKPGSRSHHEEPGDYDAYDGINIEEIWGQPERTSDIQKSHSATYTLRNRQLKLLSDSAMAMVERETDFNRKIVRFAQLIQQDDPLSQDVDFEKEVPDDVLSGLREGAQEVISCSDEYVRRISEVRSKLLKVYAQKQDLARRLVPFKKDQTNVHNR
ncbi:hypothetical protein HK097_011366 [Rhizophlyctis rosea]|uniref:Transcriptional regulatory protein RXT2 N-terminal domain-containing protein n=1 Tax=Rhizophlyctis rosea TaxID=64517 RepID=A0AAD5SGW5_9FUNG|nr:hypothetical protein HK097_011366 [Rhizophlyctis rosea]